ncbi:MAG: glycosyl transferase family protein [Pseudomonadota bacterium]
MTLAPYIHAMGRGPSKARSLTEAEAQDAMAQMMSGETAPEAIGALLMLMRFRGETADEIAGFTRAARSELGDWTSVAADLDWPSYAAGRSRGLPWFLLSALLLARSGHRVLLHGWNSHQNVAANARDAARSLRIPFAGRPDCAVTAMARGGIAYVPLEALSPRLLHLLRLRDVLGLRSCMNTVCRMLNPAGAVCGVQGVFHPSYRELQQEAAALLGQRNVMILKGGGGEFERHPGKTVSLYGLAEGEPFLIPAKPLSEEHRRLSATATDPSHLLAVWHGHTYDPWAEAIVVGTAAAALKALFPGQDLAEAEARAHALWAGRFGQLAA